MLQIITLSGNKERIINSFKQNTLSLFLCKQSFGGMQENSYGSVVKKPIKKEWNSGVRKEKFWFGEKKVKQTYNSTQWG